MTHLRSSYRPELLWIQGNELKAKCRAIHALGFNIVFSSLFFGLMVNAEPPNCDRHRWSLVPVKAAMFVIIPEGDWTIKHTYYNT